MDFLAVTRLFLHVTLVVDLRERDVLQPLFFWRALLGGAEHPGHLGHLEGPGPGRGGTGAPPGEVGRLRGTCFSFFFLRAPFFGGIFDGFRIWYVFFACIVQLILLLQKQKKEGEKLKKKEEEKNQPPQPHKPQDKDPSALSALAPLQLGRLKVTVSQSHGVQPHKQGHQGLDENKDERVKGTKTACHLGRRVTAQPGSRRTASLPPRPPSPRPRSRPSALGGSGCPAPSPRPRSPPSALHVLAPCPLSPAPVRRRPRQGT